MTIADSSAASTLRGKVPTGYDKLDEALQGGFLAGSMVGSNSIPGSNPEYHSLLSRC